MKKAAKTPVYPGTTISHCNFTGVKWDAEALKSVEIVARSLENLTLLFKSQGMNVPLIQIGSTKELP